MKASNDRQTDRHVDDFLAVSARYLGLPERARQARCRRDVPRPMRREPIVTEGCCGRAA